jgi:hypothetical protein
VKKEIVNIIAIISALVILFPDDTLSQGWGGKRKPGIWEMWSINLNAGLTSFFGDLSIYDSDIMGKLTEESGPALSGILTKSFSEKFGISGQLLYGSLKGENNNGNINFESNFIEYNLHGRINFIKLFSPNSYAKIGIEGYAGVGQFVFKTTKYDYSKESPQIDVENTMTPEFVYFFGMGLSYKITDKIGATADLSMRQANNDKLDDFRTIEENFDYYSYINFGVTYYFDTPKKYSSSRGRNTKGRYPGLLPMRRRR